MAACELLPGARRRTPRATLHTSTPEPVGESPREADRGAGLRARLRARADDPRGRGADPRAARRVCAPTSTSTVGRRARGRCRPPFVVGHEFAATSAGRAPRTDVREGDRVTAEGHIVTVDARSAAPATRTCARTRDHRRGPRRLLRRVHRDAGDDNVWHLDDAWSFDVGGIHDPMGNAFHTALTRVHPRQHVLVTGCGPIGSSPSASAAGGRVAHQSVGRQPEPPRARPQMGRTTPCGRTRRRAVHAATDGLASTSCSRCRDAAAIHQAFALVRVGGRVQMLGIPAKPMEVNSRAR